MTRLAFALLLALSFGLVRAAPADTLHQSVRSLLAEALAEPAGELDYVELHRAADLHHGSAEELLAELQAVVDDEERNGLERARAQWIIGTITWRNGDLEGALTHTESYLEREEIEADLKAKMRRAQLLDALGKVKGAKEAYAAVLDADGVTQDQEASIQMRLALFELADESADDFSTLAKYAMSPELSNEERRRTSVALALLDRPKEALDVYEPEGEGTARFRQEIRLAEWAIRADEAERAQAFAWSAVKAAELRRDRNYALTVLVEAHRLDRSLDALIEKFAAEEELSEEERNVWIDTLRETGKVDEALLLFQSSRQEFTPQMQRELIEMYREAELEERMVATFRQLIAETPERIEWREGLARYHLERGNPEAAREVWRSYLSNEELRPYLLAAGESMVKLGLDDLAKEAAEICIEHDVERYPAFLFLFSIARDRGDEDAALAALQRMDEAAPPESPARTQLSEAYEQLGRQDRAAEILEGLRDARGGQGLAEDLEMRLAWLYSEIGEEEKAFERWNELWRNVTSVARRRYAEDRLMTVAARIGKIADIVIELEEKLYAGEATKRDSGLLVRLYTKIGDPVSATEVIEEFMTQSGGDPVELLREKATVFLACTDYASYEETLEELLELDPESRVDLLRQLVMSQLERGRPDEARPVLAELKEIETDPETAEFEAGVYALAGLRDEAISSYRRAIARYPDRIEAYLLLGRLLQETGRAAEGVGMFQYLVETADRDDLFTIAIDGLLNLEAPAQVIQWARRRTLERLARRHDKYYLYQLMADLSQELGEGDKHIRSLETSLAIASTRRASVLRECMDLCAPPRFGTGGRPELHRAFGRRLIGLGDLVPPQVYLDLGKAFLEADEVTSAVKTFSLASELPDQAGFQRQVAGLFEEAGYLREALRTYENVLIGSAGDVALMLNVASLQEQIGRDKPAFELYSQVMDLLLSRRPLSTDKAEEEDEPTSWWRRNRNVDEYDQHATKTIQGLLVTIDDDEIDAFLERQHTTLRAELAEVAKRWAEQDAAAAAEEAEDEAGEDDEDENVRRLASIPRIEARAKLCRRMALASSRVAKAGAIDLELMAALPDDDELLGTLVRGRLQWGLVAAARELIDESARPEDQKSELRHLVGDTAGPTRGGVPIGQATRLFLTPIVEGRDEDAKTLLQRIDMSGLESEELPLLAVAYSAAQFIEAPDLELSLGRNWIRQQYASGENVYQIQTIYDRCKRSLSGDSEEEKERRRSLDQFVISLIADDPEKAKGLSRLLPQLQESSSEPILTSEQVMALLEELRLTYPYGIGTLLMLLPAEERSSAVRGLWTKVPKTSQARFLLTLLNEIEEKIPPELGDFILGAVREAIQSMDDPFRYISYQLTQLEEKKENAELILEFATRLQEEKPNEPSIPVLRAALLQEAGREEEALAAAKDAVKHYASSAPQDYSWYQVFQAVDKRFLPKYADEILEVFAENEEPSVEILERRLQIVETLEDDERTRAELEDAIERHPKEVKLLRRLLRHADSTAERVAVYERMIEAEEDDEKRKAIRQQLSRTWRSLDHPAMALASLKDPSDKDEEEAEDEEEVNLRKFEPASVEQVKEALDADDLETAREQFRRLWRFPSAGRSRGIVRYVVIGGVVQMQASSSDHPWPADKVAEEDKKEPTAEEKEEARQRRRGGLSAYVEEIPEPEERPTTYEVLSQHEFGVAEMKRHLRQLNASELDSSGFVLKGLRRALVAEMGEAGARDHLLAKLADGSASKADAIQLLALFEENPGDLDERSRTLLGDLLRTIDPRDGQQLLRLARAYARSGATDEAARLYRWCATLTARSRWYFYDDADSFGSLSANTLVSKVRDDLEGEALYDVIDRVLQLAEPAEDDRWQGETHDQLVLSTWEECLGAAEAIERCREVMQQLADPKKSLRRRAARQGAGLAARAGDIDLAIRLLEVSLCKLPTDDVETEYWWELRQYNQPGFLNVNDYRRLFPSQLAATDLATDDENHFAKPLEWVQAAAAALEEWLAEDRVRDNVVTSIALVALRMHELGATDEARALIRRLAERDDDASSADLWIADVAREVAGDDDSYRELANQIERKLFDEDSLNRERTKELLSHIREAEGAKAALDTGARLLETTRNDDLLDLLIACAEEAGETERAEEMKAMKAEAEAAREELKRLDEEKKNK